MGLLSFVSSTLIIGWQFISFFSFVNAMIMYFNLFHRGFEAFVVCGEGKKEIRLTHMFKATLYEYIKWHLILKKDLDFVPIITESQRTG